MPAQLPPLSNTLQAIRSTATITTSEEARQQLLDALSLLFEPSPTLTEEIVPSLVERIRANNNESRLPASYADLVDLTIELVSSFPDEQKASFIGGHPRIGEVKGLSALSAAEQGQASQATARIVQTPPEVLERLAFLNAAYEKRYPGLVYITFVNGRTREQIRDELEEKLQGEGVLPVADELNEVERIHPHDVRGDLWRKELERAIGAIRDIAQSRLQKLNVEY